MILMVTLVTLFMINHAQNARINQKRSRATVSLEAAAKDMQLHSACDLGQLSELDILEICELVSVWPENAHSW